MKPIATSTPGAAADGQAPRRLIDGGGDAFERMLVEPSRNERVPRAALERLARALELPADVLPAEAASHDALAPRAEAPPARGASWLARHGSRLRLGAVGAVAIGVGLAGWRLASLGGTGSPEPLRPAPEQAPAPVVELRELPSAARPIAPPLAIAPAERARPLDDSPAERARPKDPRARAPRPAAVRQRAQPTAPAAASSTQRGLSEELRALESVQRALLDRQPHAASLALARYQREFAGGELALEAELLGVEVALASGDAARARARARAIAARPAAARYRERLEALMRAADVADSAQRAGAKAGAAHIESAEVHR
jgi:hypothetical protein